MQLDLTTLRYSYVFWSFSLGPVFFVELTLCKPITLAADDKDNRIMPVRLIIHLTLRWFIANYTVAAKADASMQITEMQILGNASTLLKLIHLADWPLIMQMLLFWFVVDVFSKGHCKIKIKKLV